MKDLLQIRSAPCYSKKNLLTCIILSIALNFTVFFFSPAEIFLGNQEDFIVGAEIVILPMLAVAVVWSALMAVALMLTMKSKKVYTVATCLLFGVLLAFYLQMLLFNGDVQQIAGVDGASTVSSFECILNFVLMYVVVTLPLRLTYDREVRGEGGESKLPDAIKGKVVPYVSAVIFVMQLFGVISVYTSKGLLKTDPARYGQFLSYEPLLSVSEEDNITVFLMDRLDSVWMDEQLEGFPEVGESLEGFTFYQNNVSRYNKTFPSVPCMLSHSEYNGGEWAGFLEEMWSKPTLPSKLYDEGYKINALFDGITTYNDYGDLYFANNLYTYEDSYRTNYPVIIRTMTYLSLTKLTPYFMKDLFSVYGGDLSNDFISYDEMRADRLLPAVGEDTDVRLCEYLKDNTMTADCDSRTFNYIHMNCSHDPDYALSCMYEGFDRSKEADVTSTTRGSLEAVITYLDMMKEAGVYDNSTIIIMSDHGMLIDHDVATLLIKPKNAERTELKYDIESELSTENFYASILEYAGLDHSEYGYSYNDIIENRIHVDRYHQNFVWHGFGNNLDNETLYVIRGNARDDDCWEIADGSTA